jgi:hypothetical protein
MQLVMICKALPIGMQDVLGRGECDYRVSAKDGLAFFKWQDNKPVYVLSNFHGTEIYLVKRTEKDGTKREFTSPMAVAHYNKYMGGVDKAKKVKKCGGTGSFLAFLIRQLSMPKLFIRSWKRRLCLY